MTAPTRSISITATKPPMQVLNPAQPAISINGVAQPAQWGTGRWDVPRDEPVVIRVGSFSGSMHYGMVEYVLQPDAPADIEYKAPAVLDRPGAIGVRGTVTHGGNNILVPIYIIGGLAIGATVLIGGVVVLFAFL